MKQKVDGTKLILGDAANIVILLSSYSGEKRGARLYSQHHKGINNSSSENVIFL